MKLYAVVKVCEVNGQTQIEVPFCSDETAAVQREQKRLLADRAPGTIVAMAEVGSCELSKAGMLDISETYDYECVRTSVLYSMRDRYPGLDETCPEVQELIGNLADHAFADVSKGADEDWSVDEAFRYFKRDVINICERD